LQGSGSLSKVTTTANTGEKEHHYSKENIEVACLAEARDQFTQANDTTFLTDPLLLTLGIIRT